MSNETVDTPVNFKDTLNLPHTDLPIRGNAKVDDPILLERWNRDQLYAKATNLNEGQEKYILHDGPPYANGHIHLGHAYNKILKDIMTKAHRMMGFHTPVKPGWDCHGLPIEFKVSQENPNATPIELKKACRAYAQHWIDVQREEFKKLGVVMDWDHPYITMSSSYEAKTVQAFGILYAKKFIERKNKTVPWCATCQTVLATAEIEHKDRKDPSLYVAFALNTHTAQHLFPTIKEPISILVWTTTPWTLPLNRGVMLHPHTEYSLIKINDRYLIVGAQLPEKIANTFKAEVTVLITFPSSALQDTRVHHPFIENFEVPIVFDDSVGLTDGTAAVHTAPGCGPIDYEIGVKNGLEIFSPISPDGNYTHGILPRELEGMSVTDGQIWVIKKLAEVGTLVFKTSITHSYPHCWRCHNGLIFRATRQWFFNLNQEDIKQRALKAIDAITFMPEQGRNFLRATVEHRWEWCLSRQRSWGVPIPALLCKQCDYVYSNQQFIDAVADHIKTEGIEYWDRVQVADLLPHNVVCPHCNMSDFKKETDILDVWFDSGVSNFAVLLDNPQLSFPADLYLEGIDQHRGWFQSSLLDSIALVGKAPMKAIMTHGFTVDGKGQKMSKSLGNVVAPQEIIEKYGTDGLRLWVASIGHDGDAVVSETVLKTVSEVHRKLRNTARGLLMNLFDYNHETDAVDLTTLTPIDNYALHVLYQLNTELIAEYQHGNFTAVFHKLADYCNNELSAFYLDIAKDRLYCDQAHGHPRRSAQTVLWYILDTITRLMAPVLSFTAEHITDFSQKNKTESIHLQKFNNLEVLKNLTHSTNTLDIVAGPSTKKGHILTSIDNVKTIAQASRYEQCWEQVHALRSALLKVLEQLRAQGIIKHSLEAALTIFIDTSKPEFNCIEEMFDSMKQQSPASFLKELMIVSQVTLVVNNNNMPETDMKGLYAKAEHAVGVKCPRCWQWSVTTNQYGLDQRCINIVENFK